jgi:hypothetical protein
MSLDFLELDSDVVGVDEEDRLGGGSYTLESGVYDMKISAAFLTKSDGGATALTVHMDTIDGKGSIREAIWITSGDKKGNKPYYLTKDGEKKPLPGYTLADSLTKLTVATDLAKMDKEDKAMNLYNPELKKEALTKVNMLTALVNKEVKVGIIKSKVDKSTKSASGEYVPTGETREVNSIDKFFRARDGLTVAEIKAGVTEATFINSWIEKNAGVTKDKSTKGIKSPSVGAPTTPKKSLFS